MSACVKSCVETCSKLGPLKIANRAACLLAWLALLGVSAGITACARRGGVGPGPAFSEDGRAPESASGGGADSGAAPAARSRVGTGMRPGAATGMQFLGGGSGGGDDAGFAKAFRPRHFEFPADYGGHPAFRTEWWYYTGNLFGADGRHFGFELTFFRYALAPEAPASASAWATNQIYMAHFAVTDTKNGRLLAQERLSRAALGLAGADAAPFRVWVEGWSARAQNGGFRLSAQDSDMALDLELVPAKPPVAQGDAGLDRKGPEPGNASYYYSLTRLAASGTVSVGGVGADVHGSAWMDREWSTSALSDEDEGWDWFALQLSDGRDVMFYRLRRKDGGSSRFSGGSLVEADGRSVRLAADDVELEPLEYWTSEKSGARYPIAWRFRASTAGLDLTVRPYVRDQEIDLSVRYWEGAVRIEGTARGAPIEGNGYLELAGY
jgi:predicted secreted hydrolase